MSAHPATATATVRAAELIFPSASQSKSDTGGIVTVAVVTGEGLCRTVTRHHTLPTSTSGESGTHALRSWETLSLAFKVLHYKSLFLFLTCKIVCLFECVVNRIFLHTQSLNFLYLIACTSNEINVAFYSSKKGIF